MKGHGVQPSDVKVSEIMYHGRGPVCFGVFDLCVFVPVSVCVCVCVCV